MGKHTNGQEVSHWLHPLPLVLCLTIQWMVADIDRHIHIFECTIDRSGKQHACMQTASSGNSLQTFSSGSEFSNNMEKEKDCWNTAGSMPKPTIKRFVGLS